VNFIVEGPRSKHGGDEPVSSIPPRFDGQQHTKQFWSRYLRVGILVFTFEAVATLAYLVLTPNAAHRTFLITFTSIIILCLLSNIPLTERVASAPWRTKYTFGWTLVAGLVLKLEIHLDGGLHSPLFVLLTLPIVSAALALEIRQVIVCGVATLGEFAYIWLNDPAAQRSSSEIAMFAMSLLGLVIIAVGVSTARSRLLDDEYHLRAELATLATTDALTGCLNHGAFYERLEVEIDRALRLDLPLSLLMIDIDYFKAFNDTFGHWAGDDALGAVGAILTKTSRSFDSVGRVGGDEFAVALPTATIAHAAQIAHRMREALSGDERPSVSVGYAALDPLRPSAEELVRDADRSLYEVKIESRGQQANQSPRTASPLDDT